MKRIYSSVVLALLAGCGGGGGGDTATTNQAAPASAPTAAPTAVAQPTAPAGSASAAASLAPVVQPAAAGVVQSGGTPAATPAVAAPAPTPAPAPAPAPAPTPTPAPTVTQVELTLAAGFNTTSVKSTDGLWCGWASATHAPAGAVTRATYSLTYQRCGTSKWMPPVYGSVDYADGYAYGFSVYEFAHPAFAIRLADPGLTIARLAGEAVGLQVNGPGRCVHFLADAAQPGAIVSPLDVCHTPIEVRAVGLVFTPASW